MCLVEASGYWRRDRAKMKTKQEQKQASQDTTGLVVLRNLLLFTKLPAILNFSVFTLLFQTFSPDFPAESVGDTGQHIYTPPYPEPDPNLIFFVLFLGNFNDQSGHILHNILCAHSGIRQTKMKKKKGETEWCKGER